MVSQLHVQDTKLSWLDKFLTIDISCYWNGNLKDLGECFLASSLGSKLFHLRSFLHVCSCEKKLDFVSLVIKSVISIRRISVVPTKKQWNRPKMNVVKVCRVQEIGMAFYINTLTPIALSFQLLFICNLQIFFSLLDSTVHLSRGVRWRLSYHHMQCPSW